MSKRNALPADIADQFFQGKSVFFADKSPASPSPETQPVTETPSEPVIEPTVTPVEQPLKKASKQATTVDTTLARTHDPMPPRHHDTVIPPLIETVRKAVKQIGKEAATHRFTPEEKQALADILYTYGRRGYKTSENEIARIAINWLVLDYKENGEESVLAKVIQALHD